MIRESLEKREFEPPLDQALQQTLEGWSREGETRGLMALRGVDTLTAVTTLAELGDLTRFDSPRQLMAFVGLVPSEHSSGSRRQRGAITKTGNAHVCGGCLSKPPGVIGSQPERRRPCKDAPNGPPPPYRPSPGRRRNDFLDGIIV